MPWPVCALSLLTPAHNMQTVQTSHDPLSPHCCIQFAFLALYIAYSLCPDILALPSYLPCPFSLWNHIHCCHNAPFSRSSLCLFSHLFFFFVKNSRCSFFVLQSVRLCNTYKLYLLITVKNWCKTYISKVKSFSLTSKNWGFLHHYAIVCSQTGSEQRQNSDWCTVWLYLLPNLECRLYWMLLPLSSCRWGILLQLDIKHNLLRCSLLQSSWT